MNSNLTLIYPTIDLFLYDLRKGTGDSVEEIEEKRLNFWRRIDQKIDNFTLKQLENIEAQEQDVIELLPDKYQPFDKENGYYYPVLIHDTFALQFDCSAHPQGSDWSYLITELKTTQQTILQKRGHTKGQLGESWFIWGQLPDIQQDEAETVKACLQVLLPDELWQYSQTSHGYFQGIKLFEFWLTSSNFNGKEYPNHVIIGLFPPSHSKAQINNTVKQLYVNLIQLFCYRHKIQWIYSQSRAIKHSLNEVAPVLQTQVHHLPTQVLQSSIALHPLQQTLTNNLTLFSTYASDLSRLEEAQDALMVNLDNYQKRLNKLQPQADTTEAFRLFYPFLQYAQEKYLTQMRTDSRSASTRLRLLENTSKTLEGIIQLEQAKRDRDLNKIIFVVSTGIGTASASASSMANFAEAIVVQYLPDKSGENPYPLVSYGFALFSSLGVGIVALGVAYQLWERWVKRFFG